MVSNRRLGVALLSSIVVLLYFLYPKYLAYQESQVFPQYPESSFGTSGFLTLPRLSVVTALALQKDHKILAGGSGGGEELSDFAVARLLPDGERDRAFGRDGTAMADFGGDEKVMGLAVREDGSIAAAGECHVGKGGPQPCAARFTKEGNLDTSFGRGGKLLLAQTPGTAKAVVASGGTLWIAGSLQEGSTNRFALWRIRADGIPDPAFGKKGVITTVVGTGSAEALTLALLPDSRILSGGYAQEGKTLSFALARSLADGSPDPAFGDKGVAKASFLSASNYLYSLVVTPGGDILIGGSSGVVVSYDAALAKFLPDGKPDPAFGFKGITLKPLGNKDDMIRGLHRLPNGKILAVGSAEIDPLHVAIVICRYLADGRLDTDYGQEGVSAPLSDQLTVNTSALQENGKPLVAGGRFDPKTGVFAGYVARFTPAGAPDRK